MNILELKRNLLFWFRSIAPLILNIPVKITKGDYHVITDGKIIKVGANISEEMPTPEKIYWYLKAVMHCALRHTNRFQSIKEGNPQLWELSCSILVTNILEELISKRSKISFTQIDYVTRLKELNIPSSLNTANSIYQHLIKLDNDLSFLINSMAPSFNESDSILQTEGLTLEANASHNSLVLDQIWQNRVNTLTKTEALKTLGGVYDKIYNPRQNYYSILKQFLKTNLGEDSIKDYTRPSRRSISKIVPYFEPNKIKSKAIKTMVLCLDSSGSCWNSNTQATFLSHINSIHQQTKSRLKIIIFDSKIQQELEIPANKDLKKYLKNNEISLEGGGGTDFRPPIKKAIEYNASVIVVLTDCYGPFLEEEPSIPTLWVTIGAEAPWGKTLYINTI